MFDRIVVGLKEGLDPLPLLDLAAGVANPSAKIHLVTAVMVGTNEDEAARLRQVESDREQRVGALGERGFDASFDVAFRVSSAAGEILRAAEEHDSELIVIGLAKRTRVGKALMGSDAQRVLLEASCPVLTARLEE